MARPVVEGRGQPGPLDRLAESLTEAVGFIRLAADAEADRLIGSIEATLEALDTAAGRLLRAASGEASAALEAWRHDLHAPVAAIAGWARMLEFSDETRRVRAAETIERNTKLLRDLLSHPPV